MHPYLSQELGRAHRQDLHRSADAWRSTRSARTRVRKPVRAPHWWTSFRARPRLEVAPVPPLTVKVRPA
jgi:hypothetical protein